MRTGKLQASWPAAAAILQMQEDIKKQSGVFQFTAVDAHHLVMSYQALNINDGILLTLSAYGLDSCRSRFLRIPYIFNRQRNKKIWNALLLSPH